MTSNTFWLFVVLTLGLAGLPRIEAEWYGGVWNGFDNCQVGTRSGYGCNMFGGQYPSDSYPSSCAHMADTWSDGAYTIYPCAAYRHATAVDCEFTTNDKGETVAYTFYECSGCQESSYYSNGNNCAYGMDFAVPRDKSHWDIMLTHYSSYLNIVPGIFKYASGTSYVGKAMNSDSVSDWIAVDGGSWWMRDDTSHNEPNGDYTGGSWLELYPDHSTFDNILFNDGGAKSSGTSYLCSTNDEVYIDVTTCESDYAISNEASNTCSGGEAEGAVCTYTCNSGYYSSGTHSCSDSAFSGGSCNACATCATGYGYSSGCSGSSDTSCTACSSGSTYSDVTDWGTACQSCSTCEAGTGHTSACTTSSNTVCTSCVSGSTYSDSAGQSSDDLSAINFGSLSTHSSSSTSWQLIMNLDTADGNAQSYDIYDFWQSSSGTNGASTDTSNAFTGDYKNLGGFTSTAASEVLIVAHDGSSSTPNAYGWRRFTLSDTSRTMQYYFNDVANNCASSSATSVSSSTGYGTVMGTNAEGEYGTLNAAEPMIYNYGAHTYLYSNYKGASNDFNRLTVNDNTNADYNNYGWGLGTNYDSSGCNDGSQRPQCDAQTHTTVHHWGSGGGVGGIIGSDCTCNSGCYWNTDSGFDYDYAIFVPGTGVGAGGAVATCTACSTCAAGQGVSTACTTTSDTVCSACSNGSTYSSADDTNECQTCSTCATGQGATSTCSTTSNTQCSACSTGSTYSDTNDQSSCKTCSTCSAGQGADASCSTSSNTQCSGCSNGSTYSDTNDQSSCKTCSTCAAGQGASSTCTTSANTQCSGCSNGSTYSDVNDQSSCKICTTCGTGYGVNNACTTSSDTDCQQCNDGTVSTSNNDTPCADCTICGLGEGVTTACDADTNTECGPCTDGETYSDVEDYVNACATCSTCPLGSGSTAICSIVTDTQCEDCTEGNTYSDVDDQSECKTCSTCGSEIGSTSTCSSTLNTVCEICQLGTSYSDVDDQSTCKTCSTCAAGMGATSTCVLATDTVCAECSAGNTYSDVDDQSACKSCSTCISGEGVEGECKAATNTVCSPCIEYETYSTENTYAACDECTVCGLGYGATAACTTTTNTECEKCVGSTYSNAADASSSCLDWRNCSVGQGLVQTATNEADTDCENCYVQEYTSDGDYSDVEDMATPCIACSVCDWQCSTYSTLGYNFAVCPDEEDIFYVGSSCTSGSDTVCYEKSTYPADIVYGELAVDAGNGMCANFTGSEYETSEKIDVAQNLSIDTGNLVIDATCDSSGVDVESITFRVIVSKAASLNTSIALANILTAKVADNTTIFTQGQEVVVDTTEFVADLSWIPIVTFVLIFAIGFVFFVICTVRKKGVKGAIADVIPGDSQEVMIESE